MSILVVEDEKKVDYYEYYHGETGPGAMHQTGWSGLVANLIKRKFPG